MHSCVKMDKNGKEVARLSFNYFLHNFEQNFIIKGELIREDDISYSSNRNFKDTVFRLLMDDEANLLQLFNALEDTCFTDTETIHINTLKGPLFNDVLNDLSFSVKDWYLNIVEHQSTLAENSPFRGFVYLGRLWEQVVDMTKAYKAKQCKLPVPRLYVLYNGPNDFPSEKTYRLSDAFRIPQAAPMVELEVKAININLHVNHPLLERCPVLKEYSIFIDRVRSKWEEGQDRDTAVKESIKECMEEGVLKDFLDRHGREVYNMLFQRLTYEDMFNIRLEEAQEEIREEVRKEIREEAMKEGMERGEKRRMLNLIQSFTERGYTDKEICDLLLCDMALVNEAHNGATAEETH